MQSVRRWVAIATDFVSFRIPLPIILGVIEVESAGDPTARSSAGAIGLMQVIPKWHNTTVQALLDPRTNIRIGSEYLKELIERFGDLDLALSAYNWGPTALASLLAAGQGIPNSTYVNKVKRASVRYGGSLPMIFSGIPVPLVFLSALILGAILFVTLKD